MLTIIYCCAGFVIVGILIALLIFIFLPHTVIPLIVKFFIAISPFKKKWIHLENGMWCSYLERGSVDTCTDSILFLHGASGSAVDYLKFGSYIDKSSHLCFLNLLNHGDTASFQRDVSMEEMLNYVDEFVVKSGLKKRNFHLVGFSMGGFISVHYAAKHPEKISSIILINPAGMHEANNIILKFVSPSGGLIYLNKNEVLEELLNLMSSGTMPPPPKIILTLLRHHKNHTFERQSYAIRGIFKQPLVDLSILKLLSHVKVFYIQGELDKLAPKEGIDFFKESVPHAKHHIIKDASHIMTYTHTEEICSLVKDWTTKECCEQKDKQS